MLRRLVSTFAIVALLAPAIAECAGASEPVQAQSSHDCCPKEEMTAAVTAPSPASMTESCCRMSDEAGQRAASTVAPQVAAPPVSVAVPAWFTAAPVEISARQLHSAPVSADHVPRHLLLSVLIV